jgi:hypothetical protein
MNRIKYLLKNQRTTATADRSGSLYTITKSHKKYKGGINKYRLYLIKTSN